MASQWPSRGACPECGAGRANVQHEDGHSYCFSCKTRFGEDMAQQATVVSMSERHTNCKTKGVVADIHDRKISKATAKKYSTQVKVTGNTVTHHIYQYFNGEGKHIANKVRDVQNKRFWSEGELGVAGLFGQNIFNQSGKYITVCEGEVDAMSAYELMGSKWPVVSIKNGAASALENCKQAFNYLNKFETVVLCFDNDEPGKEAARKVAQIFEPNKCKIVSLELNDANEYLKTGQREKFTQAWWNSKAYTPAGIINLADLGESLR